ncbi:MAG: hypothetical protein JKY12_07000 [Sneathiella sp.]|nr:hypothetical protein [Sneathiella sp.]
MRNATGHQNEDRNAIFLALFLMLGSFLFLAVLYFAPVKSGRDIAVLFPPDMNLTQIVEALAPLPVQLVRTGFLDNIVVLRPQSVAPIEALKAVGAWLILDAYANGGCLFLKKSV